MISVFFEEVIHLDGYVDSQRYVKTIVLNAHIFNNTTEGKTFW